MYNNNTLWKVQLFKTPNGNHDSSRFISGKMNDLMAGLEFVRIYLDDLLILSGGSFESHLESLEKVLLRLSAVNLCMHAAKCNFGTSEVEYLGYTISRKGVKPQTTKVQAILKLKLPSTVREVRRFLGIVQ